MIEFNKDTAQVFDDFLPEDLYEELMNDVRSFRFTYGWTQGSSDPHGHFNVSILRTSPANLADVEDDLKATEREYTSLYKIWKYIQHNYVGLDKKLIRCYFNGHTHGIDGYGHYDSPRDDEWTAVLYTNHEEEWNPDWGGETVIIEDGEIVKSVLPKKNRAFIFVGNKFHSPRPLARFYTGMRKIVVFKFRASRDATFEKVSSFIKELGTMNVISRAGGNMHDHLISCYNELYRRGNTEDVCIAGGLHALYGSRTAKNAFLDPKKQSGAIREVFGERVEGLVYLCSIIARPEGLIDAETNSKSAFVKLFNGEDLVVPLDLYDDLMLIEAANMASVDVVLDRDKYSKFSDVYPVLDDEDEIRARVNRSREHSKNVSKYVEYNIRKKKKNE